MKLRFVKIERLNERVYWCTEYRFFWAWLYEGGLSYDEAKARAYYDRRTSGQPERKTTVIDERNG